MREEICGSSNPVATAVWYDFFPILTPISVSISTDIGFLEIRKIIAFVFNFCSLDDDVWNVRLNFHDFQKLEKKIGRSDITYMNLLAMIEVEGYGINDSMYHVKEKGKGLAGLELIDGMGKVLQMLDRCEDKMCIEIIVL